MDQFAYSETGYKALKGGLGWGGGGKKEKKEEGKKEEKGLGREERERLL